MNFLDEPPAKKRRTKLRKKNLIFNYVKQNCHCVAFSLNKWKLIFHSLEKDNKKQFRLVNKSPLSNITLWKVTEKKNMVNSLVCALNPYLKINGASQLILCKIQIKNPSKFLHISNFDASFLKVMWDEWLKELNSLYAQHIQIGVQWEKLFGL